VTLQSFQHVGLGPTEAQKGAEKVVVGQELRMNVKKDVFGDWLQLIRLRQLGRWRLLGGLFWKDRCLCEQFMHFWFNTWCYGLRCNTLWKPVTSSLHSRKSECGPVHQRSFGASFVAIPPRASQLCFSTRQVITNGTCRHFG
jgi:hypothetical protein